MLNRMLSAAVESGAGKCCITEEFTVSARELRRISVVIPLFNEEAVVPELMRRLRKTLDRLGGGPHQIVVVDDGSTDRTPSLLQEAAMADPRITAIILSRNFGHQIALSAAIDYADGDVIVMMDGDLQDSPETIYKLVERWRLGADVVYAVRDKRKESRLLRTCYHVFYRIMENVAQIRLPPDAGDFCLVSSKVARVLRNSRECHRYLRGLRAWAGFRQESIRVERDARFAGSSKYGWKQLFGLAFDGMFSFSVAPIRMATWLGLLVIVMTIVLGVCWVVAWGLGYSPQGFTTVVLSIGFFGGVQLMFLGVIGEYVGRIYEEVKARPLYVVQRTFGPIGDTFDQVHAAGVKGDFCPNE